MKRNKLIAVLMMFAVVVCCTMVFFACDKDTTKNQNNVRLFYDWGDGSQPVEKVIDKANFVSITSALEPPVRTGYEFIGWALDKDGDAITIDENVQIKDGLTLYAQWRSTTLHIIYDYNDGSDPVDKVVDESNILGATNSMEPASREGYDFEGWSLEKKGDILTIDENTILEDGTTLYAQWKIKTYYVYFMLEDKTTRVDSQRVEHGSVATTPSADKIAPYVPDGKVFLGWEDEDHNAYDESKPITSITFYYAIIKDVTHTVKFQDGENVIKQVTGSVGTEIIPPLATEQPHKGGYSFSHWETIDGKKFVSGAVYEDDAIYYAIYTIDAPSTPMLSGPSEDAITYGESATIGAQIQNPSKGITYSFVWYMNNEEIGKNNSITLEKLGAGEYTVRCEATASDGTLTSSKSSKTYTFNVEKATLTATIEDVNLIYGDKLPEFKPTYTGFKYDDNESVVSGSTVPSTTYSAGANIGTYYATINTLYADNYQIIGTVGADNAIMAEIHVETKSVRLSDEYSMLEMSKVYDGTPHSVTLDNTYFDGLLADHTISFTATTIDADVAIYIALATSCTILDSAGVDVTANYDVYCDITLTITQANIDYETPTEEETTFTYDGTYHQAPAIEVRGDITRYTLTYSTDPDAETREYTRTIPSFKDAGLYTVYFHLSAGDNYTELVDSFTIEIECAQLTIRANEQTTTYGAQFALDQTAYKIEGTVYGSDKIDITLSCDYAVGSSVGDYSIFVSYDENPNYDIYTEDSSLQVEQATLTVIMQDATISYGEYLEDVESYIKSVNGLYEGDEQSNIICAYVDSSIYTQGSSVGEYEDAITCELLSGNYTLTLTKGTLSVEKKQVSVEFDLTKYTYAYGVEAVIGAYNYCSGTADKFYTYGEYIQFINDVEIIIDEYTGKLSNVGTYSVSASVKKDSDTDRNYIVTFENSISLEIIQRDVDLVLEEVYVTYGEKLDMSSLKYHVAEGFNDFLDEDKQTISEQITYSTNYKQGDFGSGLYWTMSVANDNYFVSYEPQQGQVLVTQRNVTLSYTNTNIAQKANGTYDVDITNDMISGAYQGDEFGGIIRIDTSDAGIYTATGRDIDHDNTGVIFINAYETFDGDVRSDRYTFTLDINIEVKKIDIKHEVSNLSTTYNGEAQGATLTLNVDNPADVNVQYTYDGNTFDVMPTFTNAGTYTVSYTLTQEGKSPYYGEFTFTIGKLNATIVANAQSAVYSEDFNLDKTAYTTSGILDKDLSSLNIAISCEYSVGNDVGSYTINVTYTTNNNYNVTVGIGTLTVSAKQVNISGTGYATVYGEKAGTFASFVIDDENAREYISIKPIDYTVGAWGTFKTQATSSSKNYAVASCSVEMSVTARPITIKANNAEITYGKALPSFDYKITSGSLVGTDTIVVTYANIDSLSVGTRDIVPVATHERYAITAQNGTLTIAKASLNVTLSEKQTITYGEKMPTYTADYTGFKYDDNASVLKGTLLVACDYMTTKKAGTFAVTASGLSADNYDISYVASSLVVNKADLTITANAHDAITYGDDVPTFTYTAQGFVNGDTSDILAGKVSITTEYKQGSNAGSYTFNAVCSTLDNYNVTIGEAQTLVVNKANYTPEHVEAELAKISLSGTYDPNKTLKSYVLPNGFDWVDETIVPTCVNQDGYDAKFHGDTTNYNEYEQVVKVTINLAKADPHIHKVDESAEFGTDYTGEAINYISIIGNQIAHNNKDVPSLEFTTTDINIVDGGIYTITYTLEATTNYTESSLEVSFKVKYVDYNGTLYTLEDALAKVTSGTLIVKGNGFVSGNITIPKDVTLDISNGDIDTGTASKPTYGAGISEYVDNKANYILYKLTINSGVSVTINGTIIIRGLLGVTAQGLSGHTSGVHSQIINDGTMTLKNGATLVARGYIKGDGKAIYESGSTVYMPFVIADFRGGTSTVGAYNSGKISPFNEFEMPNVQCNQRIESGSSVIGYCDLYIATDGEHKTSTAKIFGSSSALINLTTGYIEKTYEASGESYNSDRKTTLNINGDINSGSLQMKIEVSILSADVDTSSIFLPINYRYSINVLSGTATVKSSMKFLPGSSLYVAPGAKVYLDTSDKYNAQLSFYKESDWNDTGSGAPGRTYPTGKGDATFTLGGTVTMSNSSSKWFTEYYSGIGGDIIGIAGASITTHKNSVVSVTTSEGYGYTESSSILDKLNAKYKETASITKTTILVNADNSTVTASKGTTYTYNGTSWS